MHRQSSATALATLAGIITGLLAGYFRGWTDTFISRSIDVLLAIPYLLLATGLAAACTLTIYSGLIGVAAVVAMVARTDHQPPCKRRWRQNGAPA